MEDEKIVGLFWERSEDAIHAVDAKYKRFCWGVAEKILQCREDVEECINDTWRALWDTIPPQRPENLISYLARITRNQAMKRLTYQNAAKRQAVTVSFEELGESVPDKLQIEQVVNRKELTRNLNIFLVQLDDDSRNMFLRRYWFCDSIEEIAAQFGLPKGVVKTRLYRIRKKLKAYLEKEVDSYVG